MIIAQVCLRLATIKGNSKICSFTVFWGGGATLRIELIRLLIVSCKMLVQLAGYWQELEHAVLYADPLYPKHVQWVTCLVSMLAMQELGCFQLPGIVYRSLQHGAVQNHEVMVMDEWHNNGPQDLVTVSLCI